MRTAHLFAGAGGGLLADLILGHHPVVAVEWDAYACAVLRARFPGVHVIEGDVRGVDFRCMAGVDALCAGFPCTDISASNPSGQGIDGDRSGLYREAMRAIDVVRPEWVFLENSPRIRLKGRHIVIADLVARGYSWRDGILGAADTGAPHQRDRWWLLAHRHGDHRQAGLPVDGGRCVAGDSVAGHGCADVAGASRDGSQDTLSGRSLSSPAGDSVETTAGCDQRSGWWKTEPGMGRVVDGLAAGAHGHWPSRIKCLGNGQVPLAAAVAWRLLGGP